MRHHSQGSFFTTAFGILGPNGPQRNIIAYADMGT